MIWSDERIETLIKLWDGGQSAGEIRKVFECSRNVVIGKIARLRRQGRITRVSPSRPWGRLRPRPAQTRAQDPTVDPPAFGFGAPAA
jgi:GcrA cell cycle regulator